MSSKLWSSQWWTQSKELRVEAWKSQDFNGVWARDLAIPVQRSNQLSYKATDVGNWSFVSPNVCFQYAPVKLLTKEIFLGFDWLEWARWLKFIG